MRSLSGGERNRLLLARLFARPANVLVLDEPTNDLDIDTLDLLEELLENYEGTVFLVSHDRTFLDNVVTSTLAFEGNGLWREYEGGVQDWLLQSKRSRSLQAAAATSSKPPTPEVSDQSTPERTSNKPAQLSKKKLSYKEQRELDQLPGLISALETEQKSLQDALSDGSLFGTDPTRAAAMTSRAAAIDEELMTALERWTALSE